MASIHKRKLTSGEVVWELTHGTGKDRQRFIAGRSRAEATAALKHFEEQLAVHGAAPEGVSVAEAIARFGTFLEANRRASTTRRYQRVLRTFNQCYLRIYCPDVARLRDVKPPHLEGYKVRRSNREIAEADSDTDRGREQALRERQRQHPHSRFRANAAYGWLGRKRLRSAVTPRTINYELRVVSTFFQWAVRNNLLTVNPATRIERLRVPKRALPKFMTSDDLKAFFGACSERDRRLFMTILLSGMRRGEVEYLTWEDVSFELGIIFIREKPDLKWQPKTDERIIPMSPVLHQILLEQQAARARSPWVFPNREGEHDTHILEKLQKVCRKAGIRRATVHALRHSFGAHLRMAGVSLADIGDLLGHKDLATTQIYAKVQQEHLRAVVSKLNPLVAPNVGSPPRLPATTQTEETVESGSAAERPSGQPKPIQKS